MRKTILGLACLLLAAWVLLQGNFGIPVIHINVWLLGHRDESPGHRPHLGDAAGRPLDLRRGDLEPR